MARPKPLESYPPVSSAEQDRSSALTENEGSLLALVLRSQPVTPYNVLKTYERSPVTSFNESKGSVYPAIRRLQARGLLTAAAVAGDGRNAKTLACTEAGRAAVVAWVKNLAAAKIGADDPLGDRVLSFPLLSRSERLEWIAEAKSLVAARLSAVAIQERAADDPFERFAFKSSAARLRATMEWLDELMFAVVKDDR